MADPKKLQYNKEDYTQQLFLFRFDPKKSDEIKDTLVLFNDAIKSFKVYNDLLFGLPKIEVLFEDVGNQEIPKFKADGHTLIGLEMEYAIPATGEKINLHHTFSLQNIELIDKKTESTVYKLLGNSFFETYMNAQILYSSKTKKEASKIVPEILKAGNYPFEPDKEMTDSKNKLFYITPVNATLKESIDNILSYTVDPTAGIFYVMHHLLKNKAKIVNIKDVFEQGIYGKFNGIIIPTKDSFSNLESSLMDLEGDQVIGGNDFFEKTKNVTLNNFDYLNRKWSQDKYDFNRLSKTLPQMKPELFNKIYKSLPDFYSNKNIQYRNEFQPIQYSKLRDKIHQLNMYSDVIQFKTIGNITREIGELILIESADPLINNRFGGAWFIERIYHNFSGGTYMNEIVAVRVSTYKTIYRETT